MKYFTLMLEQILYYYECPTLIYCTNQAKQLFILTLLDDQKGSYIGKELSQQQTASFLDGKSDLRTMFLESEAPFLTGTFLDRQTLQVTEFAGEITEAVLPDEGLYYLSN